VCNVSQEVKVARDFDRYKRTLDGLQSQCKACMKAARKMVSEPTVSEKLCARCQVVRPASDFFRQSNSGVGLQSYCKPCKQQVKAARCTLCHLCIHPSACYGFRVFACLGFSLGRPAARGACLF
jgi:hypothetical protein